MEQFSVSLSFCTLIWKPVIFKEQLMVSVRLDILLFRWVLITPFMLCVNMQALCLLEDVHVGVRHETIFSCLICRHCDTRSTCVRCISLQWCCMSNNILGRYWDTRVYLDEPNLLLDHVIPAMYTPQGSCEVSLNMSNDQGEDVKISNGRIWISLGISSK